MGRRRRARAFAAVAAATLASAVALASPRLSPRAPEPAPVAASAPPAGAALVARRFLVLYARAYAAPLSREDTAALSDSADPQIAAVLLGQPPVEWRASGKVVALRLGEVDSHDWTVRAELSFRGLRVRALLLVRRAGDGGWRVAEFEPRVASG
jgi:hypothetical protein